MIINILSNNVLSSKKFQGKKVITEKKEKCTDFEDAIMKCEIMICDLRDNYRVEGDEGQESSQDEVKGKLGKR